MSYEGVSSILDFLTLIFKPYLFLTNFFTKSTNHGSAVGDTRISSMSNSISTAIDLPLTSSLTLNGFSFVLGKNGCFKLQTALSSFSNSLQFVLLNIGLSP